MSVELSTLAIVVPLLAALGVGAVPRSEPALARALGLIAALVELALITVMVLGFDPAGPTVQHAAIHPWLPAYAVAWSLGVDGTALPLLVLIGVGFVLAMTIGGPPRSGEPPLIVGMLGLQAAWVAVVLARDLITLAAAWELATFATVILLGERGDGKMGVPGRTAAARRYAAHVLPGAAAMVAVVVLLGVAHAHASGGVWSWNLDDIAAITLPADLQYMGFGLAMLAVAVVLPLWPLHGPLVRICVSGPTPVVAAVLGVGMPMAVFVLERVALPMFPLAAGEWADPIAAIAVVGAILAALTCWAEREVGRLLAHVALLHASLAIVAAVSGSPTARLGLGPYLLAHGIGLAVLTAVCHALRRDGVGNLGELAGWAGLAPRGLLLALLATLLLAGAPGSAGFIGELGIIVGVIGEGSPALLRPAVWSLLGAACVGFGTLGLLRSMWHAGRGAPRPGLDERLHELDLRETSVAIVGLAVALIVGVMPGWLLARSEPAVRDAVERQLLARCLAIEARNQPRPRTRDELGTVCLDPLARVQQFYGLGDPEPAEPEAPK